MNERRLPLDEVTVRLDGWIVGPDGDQTRIPYSIGKRILAAMPERMRPSEQEEVRMIRQRMLVRHRAVLGD